MKKSKKLIALLMVSTMMIAGLAACGKKEDDQTGTKTTPTQGAEPTKGTEQPTQDPAATKVPDNSDVEAKDVSLKLWAPQEEQEILKQMCETFNTNHPEWNMKFEYGVVPEGDAKGEILKDVEAGADIFMFASGGTPELVQAGAIYPLAKISDSVKAIHGEAAFESGVVDDMLYAVPFTPNSFFMYYNKSMYTEDEVKSLETMMAKDLGPTVKNFSFDMNNSWYIESFFLGAGCTLFGPTGSDETECSFNNETGVKVGNYILDLVNNPKYSEEADGKFKTELKEGTVAAACSGTWDAGIIKEALGDNYAAAKLPTFTLDGTEYQLSNFADFKSLGVNALTKEPEAAIALAEYLGGEECQRIRFEKRQVPPTVMALANDPLVMADPATVALTVQTNYSTVQPTTSKMNNYWSASEAFGNGVINGEITKDNMKAKLDLMVNSILTNIGE